MGFIKHALIGIALYEAVKYLLKKEDSGFDFTHEGSPAVSAGHQQLRREEVDVIAGARQTDQLERMKKNAASGSHPISGSGGPANTSGLIEPDSGDDLSAGFDPEIPLGRQDEEKRGDDPWKKSLANDELRAPDS